MSNGGREGYISNESLTPQTSPPARSRSPCFADHLPSSSTFAPCPKKLLQALFVQVLVARELYSHVHPGHQHLLSFLANVDFQGGQHVERHSNKCWPPWIPTFVAVPSPWIPTFVSVPCRCWLPDRSTFARTYEAMLAALEANICF